MDALLTKLHLILLLLHLSLLFTSSLLATVASTKNLISCETTSPDASGYLCERNATSKNQSCQTYAILYTNSYYSSLSNITSYLGINKTRITESNGLSPNTDFLPINHPLLIPIDCKCSGEVFQAVVNRTTIKDESFYSIAESLEGLSTCKAIRRENNPTISPWNLKEKVHVSVPLRCACPSPVEHSLGTEFLISYPVGSGDSASSLSSKFNVTPEAFESANSDRALSSKEWLFRLEGGLLWGMSVLIPLKEKPILGSLMQPSNGFPKSCTPPGEEERTKRKLKKSNIGTLVAAIIIPVGSCLAIAASFLFILRKKQQQQRQGDTTKMVDAEFQQLNLSIRTTSEKKVSFDGIQSNSMDGQQSLSASITTPRKMTLETYTVEDIKKATEDFNPVNLIEGSVYRGRLKGKDVAIKRTDLETISQVEFMLFQESINRPNIIRMLGVGLGNPDNVSQSSSSSSTSNDSFLVFEYAKNGSLKDWLHGGLAMKSQFIESFYCFLTWNQRLRICLDVAIALQYMHPTYVHRNIKSQNIFLDEEFNAKVGNFGMSKCVTDAKSVDGSSNKEEIQCRSSNPALWRKGYLAPEYIKEGTISTETDIFAFGVILLEVLSGENPITTCAPADEEDEEEEEIVFLTEKFKAIVESRDEEKQRGWMDRALGENYPFDGALELADIAKACVEESPSLRPSAGEIVQKLSRLVQEDEELPEGQQQQPSLVHESSSKPLVQAAAAVSSLN